MKAVLPWEYIHYGNEEDHISLVFVYTGSKWLECYSKYVRSDLCGKTVAMISVLKGNIYLASSPGWYIKPFAREFDSLEAAKEYLDCEIRKQGIKILPKHMGVLK
jgi:hypothetical protein